MSESLLNRQNVKRELSKGGGIQTVSKEAIDWIDAVTREACRNLAKSGRRTPGGRLMAPKMDAGLMARQLSKMPEADTYPGQQAAEYQMAHGGQIDWSEYNDWQLAVKRGETKLPFEEWKKEQGTMSELTVGMSRLDPVPPVLPDGISISGGYVPSNMGQKFKIAIEALNKIADEDYRGNRSSGSVIAWQALKDMGERK